jgi:hypothetical protein
VFDTSGNSSAGEDAGPEVISRQIAGPSLFASVGTVSPGGGPSRVMAAVTDPAGDSDLSANGTRTPAGDDLDLLGASLANGPNKTIVATIHVKSLASLAASPSVGGPDASWILRWTEITPGVTGNGHIFFAGMDNNQGTGGGGSPGFFDGETGQIPPANAAEHTKFMTFPQTHKLTASQASFDAATGVITLRIPRADVGNPSDGTVLFSGTAFTATSTTPQSATTLFNLTDATTPFELVVGAPGTVGVSPSGPTGSRVPGSGPGSGSGSGSGSGAAGCPNASGSLSSRRIGPLALGMTRRHARRLLSHFSPRNRRFMDFFCLRPIGIRAAYPSRALERKLKRKERRAVNGRIILLLTANSRYALRGVRPGARLSEVARRLRVGRPFKVGLNMWYVTPNGAAHGLLKVRHGRIEEVGVVGRGVTPNRRASRVLLHLLF